MAMVTVKQLESKIYMMEDMLLRCKNYGKQEQIHRDLMKLRVELLKLKRKSNES